jgi:uncharacterized protein (TIGR03435 family)
MRLSAALVWSGRNAADSRISNSGKWSGLIRFVKSEFGRNFHNQDAESDTTGDRNMGITLLPSNKIVHSAMPGPSRASNVGMHVFKVRASKKTLMKTAIGFVFAATLFAQTPAFDAATVKLSRSTENGSTVYTDIGGGLSLKYMTLKDLIAFAWDVRDYQISGKPAWINSTHYDVNAKSQTVAGLVQLRPLIQPLLTERFQLVLHKSTKELVYYALVIGKNEAKLKPSAVPSPQYRGHGGEFMGQGLPMSIFAGKLGDELGRPVLDKTGLTGTYDINLQWTPDDGEQKTGPSRPSLFTAVHEQLGLKLESQKGPVEVLIVDRAERPTEN